MKKIPYVPITIGLVEVGISLSLAVPPGWEAVLTILAAVGVLHVALGILGLADYIAALYIQRHESAARADARIYILEAIRALDPATQLVVAERIGSLGAQWEGIAGEFRPLWRVSIGGQMIDLDVVQEWLDHSFAGQLPAIRSQSEGSRMRAYWQALTRFAINQGWAERARGNRPAVWVDGGLEKAWKYFGADPEPPTAVVMST